MTNVNDGDTSVCGCADESCCGAEPTSAQAGLIPLSIVWQRLLSEDGETCDRCGGTQAEVERAVVTLTEALRPLGIEPVLQTRAIDLATFREDPLESNRIWVAGRPLEAWVGAEVGATPCCSVCGDSPCRTVGVDGTSYEVVPERLLVRAAMIAAAGLVAT